MRVRIPNSKGHTKARQGVPGFLDDPVVQRSGEFMSAEQLVRNKCAEDLQVVKVAPPSVLCKRLWEKTNHTEMGDIRAVALAAFGTIDAKHVEAIQKWFAHRRFNNSRRPRSISNGGVAWLRLV